MKAFSYSFSIAEGKYDFSKIAQGERMLKGVYLMPANVQNRRSSYNKDNFGSPCFRVRPRYNSEYMWNKPYLEQLKPISGTADNYQCSIPWFAYPGDQPK